MGSGTLGHWVKLERSEICVFVNHLIIDSSHAICVEHHQAYLQPKSPRLKGSLAKLLIAKRLNQQFPRMGRVTIAPFLKWRFPEMGVPPSYHPFVDGMFNNKPSILGYLHLWKPQMSGAAVVLLCLINTSASVQLLQWRAQHPHVRLQPHHRGLRRTVRLLYGTVHINSPSW